MRHFATAIQDSTGHPYPGCPWHAFSEPIVGDVLDVYPRLKDGTLGVFLGPRPPVRLLEAIGLYDRQLTKLLADERKKAEQRAKNEASSQRSAVRGVRGG